MCASGLRGNQDSKRQQALDLIFSNHLTLFLKILPPLRQRAHGGFPSNRLEPLQTMDYTQAYAVAIPRPSLQHSFRLVCDLEPLLSLGSGAAEAGQHNWVSFSGGSFEGTFGKGEIMYVETHHLLSSSQPDTHPPVVPEDRVHLLLSLSLTLPS